MLQLTDVFFNDCPEPLLLLLGQLEPALDCSRSLLLLLEGALQLVDLVQQFGLSRLGLQLHGLLEHLHERHLGLLAEPPEGADEPLLLLQAPELILQQSI